MNRKQVMGSLQQSEVVAAIVWAFASACERVSDDLAPGTGYSALTAGVGRYDQFSDRLDRVFSTGVYAVPEGSESVGLDVLFDGLSEHARRTMPLIPAGQVVRNNLNGSNGWAYSGYRLITHSIQPGEMGSIDWTKEKSTKQLVARQNTTEPAEMTLLDSMLSAEQRADLREQAVRPAADMPTFLLAHAMGRDTDTRELAVGQPRYNDDHGYPWVWFESLLDGPELGESKRPAPERPSPSDDAPDVPLRLRPVAAENTQ